MSINLIVNLFRRPLVINQCRHISRTSALFAEPPRKKRRVDPVVFRARTEKKIKKLEREVSKLEAEPKQFIPILEYELTTSELRDLNARPRHTMDEFGLTEASIKAAKRLWILYRQEQSDMETRSIRMLVQAQTKALAELKELDQKLHDETLRIDEDSSIVPYRSSHLRKETPPNANYVPSDGYIKDVTKEWVM